MSTFSNPLLWSGTIFFAAPLVLAAVGGVISERAGVLNIGMEGMILLGAFFSAFMVDHATIALHPPAWFATSAGVLGGVLAASIAALVLGFSSIRLRASQLVVGMGINLAALGLTTYLFDTLYPNGPRASLPGIPPVSLGPLSHMHFLSLGEVLFRQNPLVYAALLLALAAHLYLFQTKFGLRHRATGEDPRTALTAGIKVARYQYGAVLYSGALCGLAGSLLVLNGAPPLFAPNMTQGRGFIALAAIVVGRWTPLGAFGACLLFGFGESLSTILSGSSLGGFGLTDNLLALIPYLITLVVVAFFVGRSLPPAADGQPVDLVDSAV